jgi:hypothetical protein
MVVAVAASVAAVGMAAGASPLLKLVAAQENVFEANTHKGFKSLPNPAVTPAQQTKVAQGMIAICEENVAEAEAAMPRFSAYAPASAQEQKAKPVVLKWLREVEIGNTAQATYERDVLANASPAVQKRDGAAAVKAAGGVLYFLSEIGQLLHG